MPYAVALGLLVAILDLIPLAGATIAAILVTTVAFLDSSTSGVIVLIFFIVYQQFENHVLQPLVYGRTVQLSPLVVLIAVLIGAELAGVIGALAAIPSRAPCRCCFEIGRNTGGTGRPRRWRRRRPVSTSPIRMTSPVALRPMTPAWDSVSPRSRLSPRLRS